MGLRISDCYLRDSGYYAGWDVPDELGVEYIAVLSEYSANVVEVGFRSDQALTIMLDAKDRTPDDVRPLLEELVDAVSEGR
jgi:hypothetical protein